MIGVGVGPGDPELVTVKGVRVLREADVVFVPVLEPSADEIGRAEATVLAHVGPKRVRRIAFALDDRSGASRRRNDAWDRAGATVAEAFDKGAATVAFATIGDPNVYSTFSYLAQTVQQLNPEVDVETVPGITAMQDLAARSATVLVEGRESLALVPMTAGTDTYEAALRDFDTVVAYKGGRFLPQMLESVKAAGRLDDAVYGADLGLPSQTVVDATQLDGSEAPYLSTLIVTPSRGGRGVAL